MQSTVDSRLADSQEARPGRELTLVENVNEEATCAAAAPQHAASRTRRA
jgi:hypothetical protein